MTSESLSEQHQRMGQAVTSLISDHAGRLEQAPVASRATPAELKLLFDEPLPEAGISAEEIFAQFEKAFSFVSSRNKQTVPHPWFVTAEHPRQDNIASSDFCPSIKPFRSATSSPRSEPLSASS